MSATKFILLATLCVASMATPIVLPLVNGENLDYTVQIQLGTTSSGSPAGTFEVIIDTGSSNLWVTGIACEKSANCQGHNYFNPASSVTYKNLNEPLNLAYGSGETKCELVSDTVHIGGLSLKNYAFGICSDVEVPDFSNSGYDGILGLAFQTIAEDNVPPLFQALSQAGEVVPAQFSIYLDAQSTGSSLILGGVDQSCADSEFVYVNLLQEDYWLVPLEEYLVNGEKVALTTSQKTAIIDSGTSLLTVPAAVYEKLAQYFPDQEEFDCSLASNLPTIAYVLPVNGQLEEFQLPGATYVVEIGDNKCIVGIQSMDTSAEGVGFIMGDVFLRSFYTLFDFQNGRVGISVAKPCTPGTGTLGSLEAGEEEQETSFEMTTEVEAIDSEIVTV